MPLRVRYNRFIVLIMQPHEDIILLVLILFEANGVFTIHIRFGVANRSNVLRMFFKHLLSSSSALTSIKILNRLVRLHAFWG